MRHKDKRLQLNRFTSWYKATLASMARSVLIYQSIRTTKTKAMAAKPLVEKLITLAKENTLAAKRRAYAILGDHRLVKVLFNDIGPRFAKRTGGYTRVLSLGNRRGDGAQIIPVPVRLRWLFPTPSQSGGWRLARAFGMQVN